MPQYNEDFYNKPVANTMTNEENISIKIKHRIRISTLIQYIYWSFSWNNKQEDKIKKDRKRKGRSKNLLADDMTLYISNPKDSTRKLFQLINTFNKVKSWTLKENIKSSLY